MAVVTMRQLLESGVHFGHQTRRWNPKMEPHILTERNGIYIIDLQQTLTDIDRAYDFTKETVRRGGTVLFVGTKKQAQEAVESQASRVGMPYVNHRWLGGMLTNFETVSKRLAHLKELEQLDFEDTTASGLTKKELLMKRREKDKLARTLGGIRDMSKVPAAVWVVDTVKEHLAVAEANKLGIPIIAILDTNSDPEKIAYGVPGNDDAIRSVDLLTRVIADAVADGLLARSEGEKPGTPAEDAEPLAEWERELLEASAAGDAAEGTVEADAKTVEQDMEKKDEKEAGVEVEDTAAAPAEEVKAEEKADDIAAEDAVAKADEDTVVETVVEEEGVEEDTATPSEEDPVLEETVAEAVEENPAN